MNGETNKKIAILLKASFRAFGVYTARVRVWSGWHVQARERPGGALFAQSDGEKLTRIGRDGPSSWLYDQATILDIETSC